MGRKNRFIRQYAFLWAVAVCMGTAYFFLCFNHNVLTDEAFTFWMLKKDYAGIVESTALDVHPPLYYLIAKTAVLIFPTYERRLLVQKTVSIIPAVLTMGIGGSWIFSRGFGIRAALLFQGVLGVLPCTMEYAVQVRMYSWGLFFITLCGMAAYDAYGRGRKRDWILFACMGLGAAYTHNYAFASACVICGLLFLCIITKNRKRLLPWLISSGAMVLLYIPWFRVLVRQAGRTIKAEYYWIGPITWKSVWGYFEWAFDNGVLYSTVMVLIVLITAGVMNLFSVIRERKKEDIYAALCWMVPFFTALGGILVSLATRPIYYDRYVYPAMGLLCLFLAISFRKVRKDFYVTLMLFLVCYGGGSYRKTWQNEYHSSYVSRTMAFF